MKSKKQIEKKVKRKLKATRDSMQKRTKAAPTFHERKSRALSGRSNPLNRIESLISNWKSVRFFRDNPNEKPKSPICVRDENDKTVYESDFYAGLLRTAYHEAKTFIRDAMFNWDYEMLAALAKEMKCEYSKPPHQIDRVGYLVLKALEKGGAVKQTEIAKDVAAWEKRAMPEGLQKKDQIEARAESLRKTVQRKLKAFK